MLQHAIPVYEANILQMNYIPNRCFIILHAVQVIILTPGVLRVYVLEGTMHSSPSYAHSSPPKYKHASEPGLGDDLNVYSNRGRIPTTHHFPPYDIWATHSTHHHQKIVGWSIWGPKHTLPFTSLVPTDIRIYCYGCINIHIENPNVVCLILSYQDLFYLEFLVSFIFYD